MICQKLQKTGREYKPQQISFFPDLSPLHQKKESPDTCKNMKEGLKPKYCVHQS